MKRASSGYTFVEVMIVLAITSTIFVSAVTIFQGKQGETQFNQAMYDLESKINLVVNDVGRSVFPSDNYDCQRNTTVDRPYLTSSGTVESGTSQDCIFLGKAVEARQGENIVRIYTVLGNRTYQSGGSRVPVTSFANARPEPAVDINQNLITALIEEHSIAYGDARIIWACSDASACPPPSGQQRELAGFYNSLQTTSDPDLYGSQSLLTQAYRMTGGMDVRNCIEQNPGCQPADFQAWKICMESGNGKNTALLTINSNASGINTQLQIKPDPAVCA